jgi:hypothetical protein
MVAIDTGIRGIFTDRPCRRVTDEQCDTHEHDRAE